MAVVGSPASRRASVVVDVVPGSPPSVSLASLVSPRSAASLVSASRVLHATAHATAATASDGIPFRPLVDPPELEVHTSARARSQTRSSSGARRAAAADAAVAVRLPAPLSLHPRTAAHVLGVHVHRPSSHTRSRSGGTLSPLALAVLAPEVAAELSSPPARHVRTRSGGAAPGSGLAMHKHRRRVSLGASSAATSGDTPTHAHLLGLGHAHMRTRGHVRSLSSAAVLFRADPMPSAVTTTASIPLTPILHHHQHSHRSVPDLLPPLPPSPPSAPLPAMPPSPPPLPLAHPAPRTPKRVKGIIKSPPRSMRVRNPSSVDVTSPSRPSRVSSGHVPHAASVDSLGSVSSGRGDSEARLFLPRRDHTRRGWCASILERVMPSGRRLWLLHLLLALLATALVALAAGLLVQNMDEAVTSTRRTRTQGDATWIASDGFGHAPSVDAARILAAHFAHASRIRSFVRDTANGSGAFSSADGTLTSSRLSTTNMTTATTGTPLDATEIRALSSFPLLAGSAHLQATNQALDYFLLLDTSLRVVLAPPLQNHRIGDDFAALFDTSDADDDGITAAAADDPNDIIAALRAYLIAGYLTYPSGLVHTVRLPYAEYARQNISCLSSGLATNADLLARFVVVPVNRNSTSTSDGEWTADPSPPIALLLLGDILAGPRMTARLESFRNAPVDDSDNDDSTDNPATYTALYFRNGDTSTTTTTTDTAEWTLAGATGDALSAEVATALFSSLPTAYSSNNTASTTPTDVIMTDVGSTQFTISATRVPAYSAACCGWLYWSSLVNVSSSTVEVVLVRGTETATDSNTVDHLTVKLVSFAAGHAAATALVLALAWWLYARPLNDLLLQVEPDSNSSRPSQVAPMPLPAYAYHHRHHSSNPSIAAVSSGADLDECVVKRLGEEDPSEAASSPLVSPDPSLPLPHFTRSALRRLRIGARALAAVVLVVVPLAFLLVTLILSRQCLTRVFRTSHALTSLTNTVQHASHVHTARVDADLLALAVGVDEKADLLRAFVVNASMSSSVADVDLAANSAAELNQLLLTRLAQPHASEIVLVATNASWFALDTAGVSAVPTVNPTCTFGIDHVLASGAPTAFDVTDSLTEANETLINDNVWLDRSVVSKVAGTGTVYGARAVPVWTAGVLVGSGQSNDTTAAAAGPPIGVLLLAQAAINKVALHERVIDALGTRLGYDQPSAIARHSGRYGRRNESNAFELAASVQISAVTATSGDAAVLTVDASLLDVTTSYFEFLLTLAVSSGLLGSSARLADQTFSFLVLPLIGVRARTPGDVSFRSVTSGAADLPLAGAQVIGVGRQFGESQLRSQMRLITGMHTAYLTLLIVHLLLIVLAHHAAVTKLIAYLDRFPPVSHETVDRMKREEADAAAAAATAASATAVSTKTRADGSSVDGAMLVGISVEGAAGSDGAPPAAAASGPAASGPNAKRRTLTEVLGVPRARTPPPAWTRRAPPPLVRASTFTGLPPAGDGGEGGLVSSSSASIVGRDRRVRLRRSFSHADAGSPYAFDRAPFGAAARRARLRTLASHSSVNSRRASASAFPSTLSATGGGAGIGGLTHSHHQRAMSSSRIGESMMRRDRDRDRAPPVGAGGAPSSHPQFMPPESSRAGTPASASDGTPRTLVIALALVAAAEAAEAEEAQARASAQYRQQDSNQSSASHTHAQPPFAHYTTGAHTQPSPFISPSQHAVDSSLGRPSLRPLNLGSRVGGLSDLMQPTAADLFSVDELALRPPSGGGGQSLVGSGHLLIPSSLDGLGSPSLSVVSAASRPTAPTTDDMMAEPHSPQIMPDAMAAERAPPRRSFTWDAPR